MNAPAGHGRKPRKDNMQKEQIKVLIACEESQAICKEFRKLGVEAYSCDLQESSGGLPQWHIKGDCVPVIETGKFTTEDGKAHSVEKWTLIIAHPPCTYLSNAGACHLWRGHVLNEARYKLGMEGKAFFMYFYNLNCEHVAIENPIPSSIYELPKRSQIIQPYEYGHPYSKKLAYGFAVCPCLYLLNTSLSIYHLCHREVTAKAMTPNIKVVAGKAEAVAQEARLSKA